MKPIVAHDRQVITSGHPHEVVDMSLDEQSLVHLMNQFIDLYQDSQMALLREYTCNAWDSHQEAGVEDPVEVYLPDEWEPTLRIVDHGVGMSKDDLKDVFSKYGASTKRDSNEVVGMLGIGCKSALTYTEQFTIKSVKDRMRTIVSVSRNAEGAGSLHFMEHTATLEANGVTITIPARRENEFAAKAQFLFSFWPSGSVLVDGKEPEPIKAEPITGTISLLRDREQSYVVMGNVPYPVSTEMFGLDLSPSHYSHHRYPHRVLAYVPIGSVEPSPSRESLRDAAETKAVLERIGADFAAEIAQTAARDVDAAESRAGAVLRRDEWRKDLPRALQPPSWTYRGEAIPERFDGEDDVVPNKRSERYYSPETKRGFVSISGRTYAGHGRHALWSRHPQLDAGILADSVILYGYDLANFTSQHRRKLDLWWSQRGIDETPTSFVLVKAHPRHKDYYPWIRKDRVYNWEAVRNTRVPRPSGEGDSGRLLGSYDAYVMLRATDMTHLGPSWVREVLASEIDRTRPIYYFVANETKNRDSRYGTPTRAKRALPYVQVVQNLTPGCTVVLMPPTRAAKFQRQFPRAREIKAETQRRFDSWLKRMGPDQRSALAISARGDDGLSKLDPRQLDDPELREAVRLSLLDIRHLKQRLALFAELRFEVPAMDFDNPLGRYPLFDSYKLTSERVLDHTYVYLNAAYAANQKGQALNVAA